MDCKTAHLLAEVRGNRDTELPAEDASHLDLHLRNCADCQRLRLIEEKVDAPVVRAMRAVPVPPGLKTRILDRMATQRGAVYRKRLFYVASAAAAVLVAVGILTWRSPQPEKLDLNVLIRFEDPKEKAERWLLEQGIAYNPPVPLNPRLLAFHYMKTIQGKQVPTLVYSAGGLFAEVFVIRAGDFDLAALRDGSGGSSPEGYHVEIHRDSTQPGKLVYVILFKGDSLEPFLTQLSGV
jgi:hypothetical protein